MKGLYYLLFMGISLFVIKYGVNAQTYCTTGGNIQCCEWITNVAYSSVNNPSGPSSYTDYSTMAGSIIIGTQFTLTVNVQYGGGTDTVMAWIDWNHNGVFTDPGDAYLVGAGTNSSYSLNITPPSWALPGQTRMRISLAYGISPPSCGTWQYGEAEDYSVYVCGSISQAASAFSNSPICYGSSSTLGLTGGIISVGANWFWYSGSCGGNYLFSGISGTVNPVVSTNYYVRAQGICSTTVCASTQVQVDPQVPKPSNVTSTSPDICPGDSCYLNGTSPGNIIKWWTASTGGTLVCSSASSANCRIIPSISAVYYAEAYDPGSIAFLYTGSVQNWTVPSGITLINVSCYGAGGGGTYGGAGGMISGSVNVSPGELFTVIVGGAGQTGTYSYTDRSGDGGGGFSGMLESGNHIISAGGGGGSAGTAGAIFGYGGNGGGTTGGSSGTNGSCGDGGTGGSPNGGPSGGTGGTGYRSGFNGSASFGGNGGNGGHGGSGPLVQNSDFAGGGGGGGYGTGGGSGGTDSTAIIYAGNGGFGGGGGGGAGATGSGNNRLSGGGGGGGGFNGGSGGNVPDTAICTSSGGGGGGGGSCYYDNTRTTVLSNTNGGGAQAGMNGSLTISWSTGCSSASRTSVMVTIDSVSVPPDSTVIYPVSICPGNSSMFYVAGGITGTAANWKWYSGSCGGSLEATGDTVYLSPLSATIYWVRAEGKCNTTVCSSITLMISSYSVTPVSALSVTPICSGSGTTLGVSGGVLGTWADWQWYTGSCGSTPVATGLSPVLNPTLNSTYYVRAEGQCNTTICVSTTVDVYSLSAPASFIASSTPVCSGSPVNLSRNGGSLGSGAGWIWYGGSCGGDSLGQASSYYQVTPSSSTTYYLRAEGTCNTTSCVSKTIIVNTSTITPLSAFVTPAVICQGFSATLNQSGGTLGADTYWRWYTGSCGGTLAGTTYSSLIIAPSISGTYYVRAINACNTTACASTSLSVLPVSTPSLSANSSYSSICRDSSDILNFSGGSLGTGAYWKWYSGSCGLNPFGTGASITIYPDSTMTFYVRAEGQCNTTTCASTSVVVFSESVATSSVVATPSTICSGDFSVLGITDGVPGTGADWYWYIGNCGSSPCGTGVSISVTPSVSTTYYVRAENMCNTTTCASKTVTVYTYSVIPSSVSVNQANICENSSATIEIEGGFLGSGASWFWYSGSCGATLSGNDSTITFIPPAVHTFYVRAEGICNTTGCLSVEINVNTNSLSATSISISPAVICQGSSASLSANGGLLGTGAYWFWYINSCGDSLAGFGQNIAVSPSMNTAYFLRAEGTCNTTSCISAGITVLANSIPAISSGSTTPICQGGSSTLVINGGYLGAGASWIWYSDSCAGTYIASGVSPIVSPVLSTTFYLRAEGTCNTTTCVSTTVVLDVNSTPGTSIFASQPNICTNPTTSLNIVGGSLGTSAFWYWYTGSCGGILLASGASIVQSPSVTTSFFVRAEGVCNTTTCSTKTISVLTSFPPAYATSTPICSGAVTTSTLSENGGILGLGASWRWDYGSCGGTFIGSGVTITVSPTVNSTYYVYAIGSCNNTNCVSTTVNILSNSIAGSTASSVSTYCAGGSTTLGISGGALSQDANWNWYSGSCGSNYLASGNPIIANPTITTTFWVRAEGYCNTTTCLSTTVEVYLHSVAADSIISIPSTICPGSPSLLSSSGGLTGRNADWYWYVNFCGGTLMRNGDNYAVTPSVTTTYWLRAEGDCNTTSCVSTTINVFNNSSNAVSISADPSTICMGFSSSLGLSGGNLGTAANWIWYSGSCGGNYIRSGNTVTVNPTSSMTYWERAEGICNITSCLSLTITVNTFSVIPDFAYATPEGICEGSLTLLGLSGGSLGTGASWLWYSGSCGGLFIGSGANELISPSVTETYFVKAAGTCNTTNCLSAFIEVFPLPLQPSQITGNPGPLPGHYEEYFVTNDSSVTQYTWNTPSGWTGAGSSNSITFLVGIGLGNISVIPLNNCGAGPARTFTILSGISVSGYFTYDDLSSTPLDSVIVFLTRNGIPSDSSMTDLNGFYILTNVENGTYNLKAYTHKPWAGVNATDAVKVKRDFVGSELFTSSIRLHAADVNLSLGINSTDAVKITRRFVGSDTSFTRGDWLFEKPSGGDTLDVSTSFNDTINVSGNNVIQGFKGLCVGDVNGSNQPATGAKTARKIILNSNGLMRSGAGEYIEIPVRMTSDIKIGAVSLIIKYPKELIHISGIDFPALKDIDPESGQGDNFEYHVQGDEIRIGWFEAGEALNPSENETLIIIRGKTSSLFNEGDLIRFEMSGDPLCEFSDEYGEPFDKVILNTSSIGYLNSMAAKPSGYYAADDLEIFPNPANDKLNVRFKILTDEFVRISLFDVLGEETTKVFNDYKVKGNYNLQIDLSGMQPGVYSCKMVTGNNQTTMRKVIILGR